MKYKVIKKVTPPPPPYRFVPLSSKKIRTLTPSDSIFRRSYLPLWIFVAFFSIIFFCFHNKIISQCCKKRMVLKGSKSPKKSHFLKAIKVIKFTLISSKLYGKETIIFSVINTWNSLQRRLNYFLLHNRSTFQLNVF